MSFNTSASELCVRNETGNTSVGYRTFALIYSVLNLLILALSVAAWLFYRKLPYLRKRNAKIMLLVVVAWICNLLAGPLSRISSNRENVLVQCAVQNISYLLVVPLVLICASVRVLLFNNRVKLNRILSEKFESKYESEAPRMSNFSSVLDLDDQSLDEISKLRYQASDRYGQILAFSSALITLGLAFVSASRKCPELGADQCLLETFESLDTVLIMITLTLLVTFMAVYSYRKSKQFPDPFLILFEIKNAILYTLLVMIPAAILIFLDLGKPEQKPLVRFNYGILFDFGIFIFFTYSIPIQIWKATRFGGVTAILSSTELQAILKDKIGRKLFRQHLVNEFSVENLNFIEAVDEFKSRLLLIENEEEKQRLALNLFQTYLKPINEFQINISSVAMREAEEKVRSQSQDYGKYFDLAYDEIFRLLRDDPFIRFRQSATFKDYVGTRDMSCMIL